MTPSLKTGLPSLRAALERKTEERPVYARLHRVLADGNFVLAVSEGSKGGLHTALYDLFRVYEGQLVEHWNTVETVAPKSEWKNENGKF